MDKQKLDELFESSKLDSTIFVGSQIRELVGMIRDLQAQPQLTPSEKIILGNVLHTSASLWEMRKGPRVLVDEFVSHTQGQALGGSIDNVLGRDFVDTNGWTTIGDIEKYFQERLGLFKP